MYILFLNFIKKNLILLYHTEQLTDGGHEEICDKNVGHGTEMVGNHWSIAYRLLPVKTVVAVFSIKDTFIVQGFLDVIQRLREISNTYLIYSYKRTRNTVI